MEPFREFADLVNDWQGNTTGPPNALACEPRRMFRSPRSSSQDARINAPIIGAMRVSNPRVAASTEVANWSGVEDAYACSWCEPRERRLLLIPYPQSQNEIREVRFPGDSEIVGREAAVLLRIAKLRSFSFGVPCFEKPCGNL